MSKQYKRIEPFEDAVGGRPSFWNPEQHGEYLEGVYKRKIEAMPTPYGHMDYIEIQHVDGLVFRVGVTAGLQRAVDRLKLGDEIKIEYLGMTLNPRTKRHYREYAVFRAE